MQKAQQHLLLQQRKKNKIWISSDFHFSHSNVIKYCGESRGHFTSVDEMNEALIDNFNNLLTECDTLIIVGDIGFAKPTEICEYLNRISCKKIIVWGNHDSKLRYSSEFSKAQNIIDTLDYLEFTHELDGKKHPICVMHFPLLEWHRKHRGSFHFHGHQHTPLSKNTNIGKLHRSKDIGIDGIAGFKPHLIDDLCKEMLEIPLMKGNYE